MRLFAICSAMEWAALPVQGGIYDQHPQLIDEWMVIFEARNRHEQRENERRKRESKR
jgi:hypothetical protein